MTKQTISFILKVLYVALAMMIAVAASAQNTVSVKLKLSDSKSGEPVGFATVSLTVKGQTTAAKYVLTDAQGVASLQKVKQGTYVLKAELMGYKPYEKELSLTKSVDLGEVKMLEDVEVLDASKVSAVGNPIVVKKDTIEYTASSFKTSDNDMLEELLKKLPGVEVGTDGSITANGETIKKITIDGKTFFLDDPQLATKNIPAKIVEKVKVVEKKSDQALFTGIDDGNEETIIDLSIRPGMMKGWFGNIMGGGGHDLPEEGFYTEENSFKDEGWRYQGAAMVGRFEEDSQVSIILNGNNTNNRGFNDMSRGMMQGMRSGGMGRGQGGWGRGNGITTSWMGGINGAFNLFDDDMDLAGNYLYSGSDNYVEELSSKITYMDDGSSLIYNNDGFSTSRSNGHRMGVRLDHKFSENTSILFEPQFNFGNGSFNEFSDFETLNESADGQRDSTNRGYSSNQGWNDNWTASGFLLFRQRLGKPGRTISAHFRYSFSQNSLDGFNQSLTQLYNDEGWSATDGDIVNQWYDSHSNSTSLSGRLVYTEPLGNNFFLEGNYEYRWNKSTQDKDTYDSGTNHLDDGKLLYNPSGAVLNDTYSNDIVNRYVNQSAGVNLQYQKEKLRAQIGASLKPTDTQNETNGESYSSKVLNWSPQAMLGYSFSDNGHVRMFYFGRSNQPSTSQLMPVPDNSDPLNVSFGNPYLTPYFNHNIRSMFGYTNKKTFTSVHARVGGSLIQDGITSAKWYDAGGAQYSMPLNGPTSGSVDGRINVNSPIGKSKKFSLFSMTYVRYNESTSYVGKTEKGDAFTSRYYDTETAQMDYDLFYNDFLSDNASQNLNDYFTTSSTQTFNWTQRLRMTYRNDFVELRLGGRTRMSKSWYTITTSNQQATWSNQIDASMNWTIPGGVNLIANVDYNWYNGYTTPQEDEIIVNAEITKLLFKDKFTLAVKAYDILNQAKNLSVTDESNFHREVRNNTLGRYIVLSLTYRFGNFNANGNRRGPGGHMGGGHRGPR